MTGQKLQRARERERDLLYDRAVRNKKSFSNINIYNKTDAGSNQELKKSRLYFSKQRQN